MLMIALVVYADAVCQVEDEKGSFDGQDAGGDVDDDDDNDDGGGVDFGLSVADDISQSQFVISEGMDDELAADGSLLTGDNLLAIPRKVIHPSTDSSSEA